MRRAQLKARRPFYISREAKGETSIKGKAVRALTHVTECYPGFGEGVKKKVQ